jgi:hypothetical protein
MVYCFEQSFNDISVRGYTSIINRDFAPECMGRDFAPECMGLSFQAPLNAETG